MFIRKYMLEDPPAPQKSFLIFLSHCPPIKTFFFSYCIWNYTISLGHNIDSPHAPPHTILQKKNKFCMKKCDYEASCTILYYYWIQTAELHLFCFSLCLLLPSAHNSCCFFSDSHSVVPKEIVRSKPYIVCVFLFFFNMHNSRNLQQCIRPNTLFYICTSPLTWQFIHRSWFMGNGPTGKSCWPAENRYYNFYQFTPGVCREVWASTVSQVYVLEEQ